MKCVCVCAYVFMVLLQKLVDKFYQSECLVYQLLWYLGSLNMFCFYISTIDIIIIIALNIRSFSSNLLKKIDYLEQPGNVLWSSCTHNKQQKLNWYLYFKDNIVIVIDYIYYFHVNMSKKLIIVIHALKNRVRCMSHINLFYL